MTTLILSTTSLPAGPALRDAALQAGWRVRAFDEPPLPRPRGDVVFYGGTDVALAVASHFGLAFVEPPLDLPARLPTPFLNRAVQYARFRDLDRLAAPAFVKPADALRKAFDAGVYSSRDQIRAPRGVPPETPVLVSDPVEWLAEFRCFVLEGRVVASSPYLSFGRPVWRPFGQGGEKARTAPDALAFCQRLLSQSRIALPPAFVVDVGLIEERGWAVVEFNPAWCSGLLGADPAAVLPVLARACHDARSVTEADSRWVIRR